MYETAFGLKGSPFALPPDTEFLLMLPQHQKAFNLLMHGVRNSEGFSLLTGEVGCGKTTLLRKVVKDLGEHYSFGLITDTIQLKDHMLDRVMLSLGLDIEADSWPLLHKRFTDYLVDEYANNRQVVVIVDEAQNLSSEALEELRVLSNINNGKYHLLHIVLAGQPELRKTLAAPKHEQLSQRISKVFHLLPLTEKETTQYIYHRMKVAGATRGIFTKEACDLIHQASRGVPRLINQLSDMALIYAYGLERQNVTVAIVKLVMKDRLEAWTSSPLDRQEATKTHAPPSQAEAESQIALAATTNDARPTQAPAINGQRTIIEGMYLLSADIRFRERFGLPQDAKLNEFDWLNIVDDLDRDRVRKVFNYYLGLGQKTFDFSATVRNKWHQEREARLSFQRIDGEGEPQYLLQTEFYDHTLSIH